MEGPGIGMTVENWRRVVQRAAGGINWGTASAVACCIPHLSHEIDRTSPIHLLKVFILHHFSTAGERKVARLELGNCQVNSPAHSTISA